MRKPINDHFKSSSRPLTAVLVMLSVLIIGLGLGTASAAPAPRPGPLGADRLNGDTNGAAIISYGASGYASFVRIPASATLPSALDPGLTSRQVAEAFFKRYGGMFGIENAKNELAFLGADSASLTGSQLVFQQEYDGVPVFAAILKARFSNENRLTGVNGTFLAGINLKAIPDLSESQANQIAVATVAGQNAAAAPQQASVDQGLSAANRGLYVFRSGLAKGVPGRDHLVYEVVVSNPEITVREFVYVDAHSKAVVDQITGIHDALDRRAYDAEGQPHPGPNYPGSPFWVEGDPFPTASGEANNMILASGETYDLFWNAVVRDSFDGLGATMDSIFNRGDGCPNASWNGTYISFCPGLTTDDITGHEWGHAYTEYTNNLIYQWQSGALSESYSDMWGETVDLINARGLDAPDGPRSDGSCSDFGPGGPGDNSYRWLMGEESSLGAIRDMWTPTCAGDPGKVTDTEYWCTADDNGGVHFNSGVPNHAFALITDGGTYNSETITGLGLTKAVHIHWGASLMLTPASDFVDHADALEASCDDLRVAGTDLPDLLTGAPSGEVVSQADCDEVGEAVDAVEFRTPPTQCNFEPLLDPNAPALCAGLGSVQPITSEDFEGGILPAGWTVGTRDVVNPGTFDTPDWAVVSGLPAGAGGSYAAFVPDLLNAGDCAADTEAGALFLDSPVIALPLDEVPRVAFTHWVATETGWDGGNVKVSVNGGPWTMVPGSDYSFNPYNSALNVSDNPLGGQEAFTGTNAGTVGGSWGQSQVKLVGLALPGDDIKLRFDFGVDGCNGVIGWYVDDVEFYSCSDEEPPFCGDGELTLGEQCDDGNMFDGDGCSASCEVEEGWICNDPTPPNPAGSNVVADWSFEGGYPNADWTPFSTFPFPGFPLCSPGTCGPALANTGSWYVWIGGITTGVTSSVEQSIVIPSAATELTLLALRGLCGPGLSDTLDIKLDGANIGTLTCDGTDGGYVEHTFDVTAYADDAAHTLYIGGTATGDGATWTNFFVDDVVLNDNTPTSGTPSQCVQLVDNLACNDGLVGFQNGIAGDWSVIDNAGNGLVWTDMISSGLGGNATGGADDAATVNSDFFGPADYDTELRSNVFSMPNSQSAAVNYLANYQNFGGLDFLDLDISTDGGSNWSNLLSWNEDHGGFFSLPGDDVSVDLTPYVGMDNLQLRWRYYDPTTTNDWDWYAQIDHVGLYCEITQVLVDIIPRRINAQKKRGVIPVAIYSSADFDATEIDPATLLFGPNGTREIHGKAHIEYVDDDGLLDVKLHFSNRESGIECGDTSASLSGFTYDGEPVEGTDTFRTKGCR